MHTTTSKTAMGRVTRLLCVGLACLFGTGTAAAGEGYITVASTTSTRDSGLFEWILPKYENNHAYDVRVVAVGTGQALKLGQRGDADVVFVHAKPTELRMVKKGYFVNRSDIMYNDFVIVGPQRDPVGIKGMNDAVAALEKVAEKETPFFSRGDDSGTNKKELSLWEQADIDVKGASGTWYRETGSGMGATLNTTAAVSGYTLTDRGTWLNFDNRRNLTVLVEGDERLFNQYGAMLVNPDRHSHVKKAKGMEFINWLCSSRGQDRIAEYRLRGEQLFTPNCGQRVGKAPQ